MKSYFFLFVIIHIYGLQHLRCCKNQINILVRVSSSKQVILNLSLNVYLSKQINKYRKKVLIFNFSTTKKEHLKIQVSESYQSHFYNIMIVNCRPTIKSTKSEHKKNINQFIAKQLIESKDKYQSSMKKQRVFFIISYEINLIKHSLSLKICVIVFSFYLCFSIIKLFHGKKEQQQLKIFKYNDIGSRLTSFTNLSAVVIFNHMNFKLFI